MKNGYGVYITSARVKGKDWLRLRIGFYKELKDAKTASKKIMALAGVGDAWVTKVDEKEIRAHAGY
jgi:hypothetical protein